MAAETKVTANAVVPDATRADTASHRAGRISQMTGKFQLEDARRRLPGLVEKFNVAFVRIWLCGLGTLHRLLSGRRLCQP
jgi:hypothetical protein